MRCRGHLDEARGSKRKGFSYWLEKESRAKKGQDNAQQERGDEIFYRRNRAGIFWLESNSVRPIAFKKTVPRNKETSRPRKKAGGEQKKRR